MKTKRSLTLHGHRTSVALEPVFWAVLDEVAEKQARSLASLIQEIDDERIEEAAQSGLASYIRVWCMEMLRYRLQLRGPASKRVRRKASMTQSQRRYGFVPDEDSQ